MKGTSDHVEGVTGNAGIRARRPRVSRSDKASAEVKEPVLCPGSRTRPWPGLLPAGPLVLFILCTWATPEERWGRFELPAGGPPFLRVGETDLCFTTSGAFVLLRGGETLMDGGVTFREEGWKRWGSQIRRTSDEDQWSVEEDGRKLVFQSALRDLTRDPFFDVHQEVTQLPQGCEFSYRLKSRVSFSAQVIGAEFHMPLPDILAKVRRLMFGGVPVPVPIAKGNQTLSSTRTQEFSLAEGSWTCAKVVTPQPTQWFLLDDRPFELQLVRSQFVLASPHGQVKQGDEIQISFVLWLNPQHRNLVFRIGSTVWSFDPLGNLTLETAAGRWTASWSQVDPASDGASEARPVFMSSPAGPLCVDKAKRLLGGMIQMAKGGAGFPYRLELSAEQDRLSLLWRFSRRDAENVRRLCILLSATDGSVGEFLRREDGQAESGDAWTLSLPGGSPMRIRLPEGSRVTDRVDADGRVNGYWLSPGVRSHDEQAWVTVPIQAELTSRVGGPPKP